MIKAVSLSKAKPGDWAFWHYDAYPYILGGKIGGLPDGWAERPMVDKKKKRVWIGSYQTYFTPRLILSAEDGQAFKDEIDGLRKTSSAVYAEAAKGLADLKEAKLSKYPPLEFKATQP